MWRVTSRTRQWGGLISSPGFCWAQVSGGSTGGRQVWRCTAVLMCDSGRKTITENEVGQTRTLVTNELLGALQSISNLQCSKLSWPGASLCAPSPSKWHHRLPRPKPESCWIPWFSLPFLSLSVQFSSVQSLSCVWLFATPRITARQASLSIINSRNSPRLTSIESVMPSSHLILCRPFSSCPQSLPASDSFPVS